MKPGKNSIHGFTSIVEFFWIFVSCYMLALASLQSFEKMLYGSFLVDTALIWTCGVYQTIKQGKEGSEKMRQLKSISTVQLIFGLYFSSLAMLVMSGRLG